MKKIIIINLILLPIILLSGIVFVNVCRQAPVFLDSNEILAVAGIENKNEINNSTIEIGDTFLATPFDLETYENFYLSKPVVPENLGEIKGGFVPHHLLAGALPASFFENLKKQNPPLIVLIGPDHFEAGKGDVLVGDLPWKTPYGILQTDKNIITDLQNKNLAHTISKDVWEKEHSVAGLVSFIKKSIPDTKIVPIIFSYKVASSSLSDLADYLINNLPEKSVVIGSVDFSHYMTWPVANFHDEFTKQIIKNLDYERTNKLEVDSQGSVYVITKYLSVKNYSKVAYELSSNSAQLIGIPWTKETTSHYSPYFVVGSPEKEKVSSILFFGDIMLDRSVKKKIDQNGQDYLFQNLAGQENRFFFGMDLITANLEGPFADSRRATTKEIAFRFDPLLLPMLQKYNFGLFGLANNHTLDMSNAGFAESKKNLTTAGFDFYGSQYRVDDESLLVKQVGDYKIGFIGLNDTNSPVEKNAVKKLIEKAKNQGADKILVSIHWGYEYKELSNTNQRELAHYFIDNGADIIIGHHPHVIQEMEIYKDKPIFYSLGNFVFDQYFSVPTQQGLAVGLVIKDKQLSISVFPLQGQGSAVSLMEYSIAEKYMADWPKNSRLQNYQFKNFNLVIQNSKI